VKLVYLGTPDMAVPPLRALVAAGHDVVLVVTRPDKRRGRGSTVSPSPVKEAALELGLPVSHDVDDALTAVSRRGRRTRRRGGVRPAREAPRARRAPMVNLHFSLLPRWRGAAPVERAILAGDDVTGVCVMALEEGLDTGGVYARREVPIGPETTAERAARRAGRGRNGPARRDAVGSRSATPSRRPARSRTPPSSPRATSRSTGTGRWRRSTA
jgi:methionyl-tRNA formyltransferase